MKHTTLSAHQIIMTIMMSFVKWCQKWGNNIEALFMFSFPELTGININQQYLLQKWKFTKWNLTTGFPFESFRCHVYWQCSKNGQNLQSGISCCLCVICCFLFFVLQLLALFSSCRIWKYVRAVNRINCIVIISRTS